MYKLIIANGQWHVYELDAFGCASLVNLAYVDEAVLAELIHAN